MSHAIDARVDRDVVEAVDRVSCRHGCRDERFTAAEVADDEPVALGEPADLLLERDDRPALTELSVHGVVVRPLLRVGREPIVRLVARGRVPAVVHLREVAVARNAALDLARLAETAGS